MEREKNPELPFVSRIKGNLLIIFNDTDRRPFLMGKKPHQTARERRRLALMASYVTLGF